MKKIILFSSFIAVAFLLNAQDNLRVEIEPKKKSDDYYVVPTGESGLVVFNQTREKGDKREKIWSFTQYDVNFKEVWTNEVSIPKMSLVKFYHDKSNDDVYILLAKDGKTKAEVGKAYKGNGSILKVSSDKRRIDVSGFTIPFNTSIEDFQVINGTAFFGGKLLPTNGEMTGKSCLMYLTCCVPLFFGGMEFKKPASLFSLNTRNNSLQVIGQNYQGNSALTSLETDERHGKLTALITNRPKKGISRMFIREYNISGELLSTKELDPKGDNIIRDGKISTLNEDEKIIIGTYALPADKGSFGQKMATMMAPTQAGGAQGVYVSKSESNKQEYIRYYSFTDFNEFTSHYSDKTAKQTERKRARKNRKGGDLSVEYNVLVHDVIQMNDKYVFLGECYYRQYRTEYYTDSNGNMRSRRVFVGYRYTHAIVAAFDKDGAKIWDETFPIWNILTFDLRKRIKVLVEGDDITMVYSYGGKLKSKVISENKISDNQEELVIDTGSLDDDVKSNYNSDMMHWYDNYFLAYGYQKIKNKETDGKKRRRIFYFNKVKFDAW